MMQFKPTKKFNSRGRLKKNPLIIFRRWYAVILSSVVLSIHVGIIPMWLSIVPEIIIVFMASLILFGLYQFVIVKKIFTQDLSTYKNPIIKRSTILEIAGYSTLSLCLFYVGWMNIFFFYSFCVIWMTFIYVFLLAKQYNQIDKKIKN